MSTLILGIDIGTSAVKGVVCNTEGQILADASREHQLISLQPGWAEESPQEWWRSTLEVIEDCLAHPDVSPQDIRAVGTSGMVPAVVLLDKGGDLLRPSIQQNDARATEQIDKANQSIDPTDFFRRTGAQLSQQSVGPKLLWIQQHEPEVWSRVSKLLGSYDYINYRLTGEMAIESNMALESGLFDLHSKQWDEGLLRLFNVPEGLLSPVLSPTDLVGKISTRAALETGLKEGTPVVAGTADHVGAALAAGITKEGDLLIKFGSAGDILYCSDHLLVDKRLYLDFHDIPGKFLINGCMATSGSLVKWFVQQFCEVDRQVARKRGISVYEYLDGRVEDIPAGSEGLVVLPYFLGEKTPINDPHARGVFFGQTLFHTRYHFYRAVLESVVFGFRHHVEVLESLDCHASRVVASEGGARSELWRQIAADILNSPVEYLSHDPGAPLAAAFTAGMGVGAFTSWEDIDRFISIQGVTTPKEKEAQFYSEVFKLYKQIYLDLKQDFRSIPLWIQR